MLLSTSVKLVFVASLFVLCDTREDESQKLWGRYGDYLCDFISNKATRQRLKLCQNRRSNGEVLRSKRDVNASLPRNISTTPNMPDSKATYPPPTTTQRSYVGCPGQYPIDPNGFNSKDGIDITVNFTKIDNAWSATVHWKRPTNKSKSKCIGYRVRWWRTMDGDVLGPQPCDVIMNENTTTYVIDASKGWKDERRLDVGVFPFPRRSETGRRLFRPFSVPIATATAPKPTTILSTTPPKNPKVVTSTLKPDPNNSVITKRPNTKTSSKQDRETKSGSVKKKPVALWLTAVIVAVVITSVLVLIGTTYRWVKYRSRLPGSESTKTCVQEALNKKRGTDYISYYSANESDTNTAMKVAAWLAQNEVNVIMDKFDVIPNGKRIWSEQQLASAEKVILIMCPGYLEICKFDQNIKKEKKLDSFMDQLAYNEICYIRDEIRKKPLMAIDRFVLVLTEVGSDELPFWMKGLKSFRYSNGALDDEILKFLNGVGNNNASDRQSVKT